MGKLSIRRNQPRPAFTETGDIELDRALRHLYDSIRSKKGINDLIDVVADPISSDLGTAQDNILTIQGDVTTAEGNITTAQGDITTLQGQVAAKLQTATYTEKWQVITPGADHAWTDVSLAAYGVVAGDVCEIVMHNFSGTDHLFGCRTNGSALARYIAADKEIPYTMHVTAAASAIIELYEATDADITSYLAGYWHFSTS